MQKKICKKSFNFENKFKILCRIIHDFIYNNKILFYFANNIKYKEYSWNSWDRYKGIPDFQVVPPSIKYDLYMLLSSL